MSKTLTEKSHVSVDQKKVKAIFEKAKRDLYQGFESSSDAPVDVLKETPLDVVTPVTEEAIPTSVAVDMDIVQSSAEQKSVQDDDQQEEPLRVRSRRRRGKKRATSGSTSGSGGGWADADVSTGTPLVPSSEQVVPQEPDTPDTDNEAGFAQRKRDQWSAEGEKEADNNEPGGTALTEQKDDRVTEERLREVQAEVALARRQFVKADFNKTSRWNTLKRVLRLQSEDAVLGANADVNSYHEIYTEKLLLFQDLQFRAIKESGVTGESMKKAFADTLRYFKYDEAVQLYQDRTDVRRETLYWGDRVVATFENIGKEYNKLSLTKKLALSAILIGGSLVTGGASLVVKRFLAGAGASASIDGVLEKVSDKKEASALEKEVREQIRGLDLSLEVDQKILQKYIQEDIASLNNKLQKKKRDILLRKGMALGVGVGVGAGIASQLVMEHLNGKEVTQAVTTYTKEVMENNPAIGSEIPETVTPDLAPDSPPDVDKGFIGEPLPDTPNVDAQTDATPTLEDSLQQLEERFREDVGEGSSAPAEYVPEAREELAREVLLEDAGKNLLEDYHLTRADGRRGLWGVLDSRLPEGIPEAEKNAMIQRLENLIAERLTEMTPEQQADAGFRSGDINRIYAGETIKFSAVLTPEDVEKIVLDQDVPNADTPSSDVDSLSNSVESGGGADVVPESEVPDTETLESATGEGVVEAPDANPVTDVREYNQEIILGKAYNLQLYKEYFRAHQEMLPVFRESGIEYLDFISRDNAGTMRTIGEKTFAVIEKSPLMEKTDLKEFIRLAEETYGKKLGSPRPKEKVYEYVMRMAMLGVEDPEERIIPLSKRFSI